MNGASAPSTARDRNAASPQRAMWMLLSLPVLATLVTAAGLAMGARGDKFLMLVLAVANIALALIPAALDQARRAEDRHVLVGMLSVMFAAYFVMPVFAIYLPAVVPVDPSGMNGANLMPAGVVQGQLMALLGHGCLLLGYATPIGRRVGALLPAPRHEWKEFPALAAACAWALFGWLIWGLSQLRLLPGVLGSGVLGGFADATIYGSALFTILYLRYGSRLSLFFLAALVAVTMPFNFFTGSKRRFLSPVVMIVLAWIVVMRRIRLTWIVLGFVTLVLLYPVSQFYRLVVTEGRTKGAVEMIQQPLVVLQSLSEFVSNRDLGGYIAEGAAETSARLDGIGRLSVIVRDTGVTRRAPFLDGYTVYLVAIAWVPRVLWPGKPGITIGKLITDNYSDTASHVVVNVAPSWIGEWYMNFGTLGVIGGMALIGIWIRLWHEILFRRSSTIVASIAGVIVIYKFMTTLGGALVGVFNSPLFALFPIFLIHAALRLVGGTVAPRADARGGELAYSAGTSSTQVSSRA